MSEPSQPSATPAPMSSSRCAGRELEIASARGLGGGASRKGVACNRMSFADLSRPVVH